MTKVKVRFLDTVTVNDHRKGTKGEQKYVKGKSYALAETSALHWINRGKAERVGMPAAK